MVVLPAPMNPIRTIMAFLPALPCLRRTWPSSGACCPVNRWNWRAAWCTSRSSPPTTVMPAVAAVRASCVGQPAYTASNSNPARGPGIGKSSAAPPGNVDSTAGSVPASQ